MTGRELNRATLARQLLLAREPINPVDAVLRVVALQAQDPASPYLALWSRVEGFDATVVDAGFTSRSLVRATLMRVTMHVVHARDYPVMYAAVQPTLRAARLTDRRFTQTGLTAADADELLPSLATFARRPRSAEEFHEWLGDRLDVPVRWVWWALRHVAPLVHVPTGGPWSFGGTRLYVSPSRARADRDDVRSDPVALLIRRYLQGFGPAAVADIAQFALVPRARVRAALVAMADELEQVTGPGGVELIDLPGLPRPSADVVAPPRLLPMWDNVLLGYADRSRVIPAEYRQVVTKRNGDVLPTVLVDGYVAGVWRSVASGIEIAAFRELSREHWDALAVEARGLRALLAERDPNVYRRQDHWWDASLPCTELRLLGGS